MPVKSVHIKRHIANDIDTVWQVLGGFDLNWHPGVGTCRLLRAANGTLLRDFTDIDGNAYREERVFVSDTDKTLRYRLTDGIDGLSSYEAQVSLTAHGSGTTMITWQADIIAEAERLDAICAGTAAIFEAGIEVLETSRRAKPKQPRTHKIRTAHQSRRDLSGSPHLSFLQDGPTYLPPVIFLHGIGGAAENWAAQMAELGGRFHTVALDLRGYGKSQLGPTQTHVDDHCDDILRLADALGAQKFVLVGLSFGSWIATSFAMRHGNRLAGLVLAGGCTGMSEASVEERESFRAARMVPLDNGQRPADFAPKVVDLIAGPQATAEARASLLLSMSEISVATYRDALRCFCDPPEKFDFSRIPCPVLLMTGEHDPLAPPTEIRAVSERIASVPDAARDVRFEVIPKAGHVCNLEQPAGFNAVLRQFLDRLPGLSADYRPTPAEKKQAKRDRILAAAHEQFCLHGFDGTSMESLAVVAGVSKPTLYHYFGDKEGLFAAVLDVGREHLIAPLVADEGTLVERLWNFSWTYADFVLRPDMLSLARLILGEAARRPDSAIAYHKAGPQKAFEGISKFIRDCVANGTLQTDEPELAAQDLWALILSGPRDHYLHHVTEKPEQGHLEQSIVHGLKVFLSVYSTNKVGDLATLEAYQRTKTPTRL